MYIFFDAVSTKGYIGLFDTQKHVLAQEYFSVSGEEAMLLPGLIDRFLIQQKVNYSDIENIICVVGPGSFTGIRIISLMVNTLAYVYPNIFLTPLSFFDLYEHYPIVKTSSKRDLFVKWEKSATIEIVENEDFLRRMLSITHAYGNSVSNFGEGSFILETEYSPVQVLTQTAIQKLKKISPNYIKKPNIS